MYLAKHHYAIAFAKSGHEVYFLNPPQEKKIKSNIEIIENAEIENLFLINHFLSFPYKIKFKWIGLFHFFMKFHIKKIEKSIGKDLDLILSFDLGHYYPFKYFGVKSKKVFFPIDEPLNKTAIKSGDGCDLLFSVTHEIIEKYAHLNVPMYFTHHGLAEEFIDPPKLEFEKDGKIHVGLSGNWLRKDIDTFCLLKIINENPEIIFEFWGAYKAKDSNIGGGNDKEVYSFISKLENKTNVILHGAVHPKQLAIEFQRIDVFLICYDILRDQSKGTNYHKVMEYLSTGKVILTNNITTYNRFQDLMIMANSRKNNKELPSIFKMIINNLDYYNQTQLINKRKSFAYENLYSKQIIEFAKII